MGADNIELDGVGRKDYRCILIWYDLSTKIADDAEEPDDYDGPMLTCINFYKDRTDKVRGVEKKYPGWTFDIDGVTIPDRKVAFKVLKLVKEWSKTMEDKEIAKEIEKLTVNDLYEE